jgi:hypothetical protein
MTDVEPTAPELVLPPTRHLGTAIAAGIATAIVLAFAIALLVDPLVPVGAKPAVAALGLLFAGTLGVVTFTLARGHGALWLDRSGKRLGLGVTSHHDVWWVPLDRITGIRMLALPTAGATIERWMLTLDLDAKNDGLLAIVLAESDARGFLDGIGQRLARHLGLRYTEGRDDAPADSPDLTAHTARYAVHRGAALQTLLLAFGSSLLAFGIMAVTQLEAEPVVGFIFAPILMVMGTALILVSLVKRFAAESLGFDGRSFTHAFTFRRWRWGERTIKAVTPRFRIRFLGLRGAMLELVGDDGTLVLAAGVTARSKLTLDEVAALPNRFLAPPRTSANQLI